MRVADNGSGNAGKEEEEEGVISEVLAYRYSLSEDNGRIELGKGFWHASLDDTA